MEGSETHMADLLIGGFIMLSAALVMVLVFRRFGIGAVLGYLIAGILIGPQGLGLITNGETILEFSEIGIILLLFIVGLELAPARLMRLKNAIFGLGLSQVVLCGIALFLLIKLTTEFSWGAAIALGLPLALSSTAQVLPMLQSSGRLNTPTGEKAFSILLFQDLSLIPMLTIVAALSRAPAEEGALPGYLVAIYGLLAIGGLILAGRYLLQPLLKIIGKFAERELFIVAGLVAVLGSAALMELIGLSPALGAFIAGVMLANSPYRHELEADIDPFRSLLLGFFFLAVGMMLDLSVIAENTAFVFGAAFLLVAIKIALIFGVGKLFGMPTYPALAMGMLLSQGGEFGFVLFAEAEKSLLIEPAANSLFGAVVTISMATTPFLMLLAQRFNTGINPTSTNLDDPSNADRASVIIVGQGRFGQTVSQMLQGARISLTLIDVKPEQIDIHEQFGVKVFYGDGTRVDLLRRAGADDADAIIFCIDDREFGADRVRAIRHSFPNAKILVRVFDRVQLIDLKGLGVVGMKREMFESAIYLAKQAMYSLDVDHDLIEEVDREFRDRDCERLEAQMKADGDMLAGAEFRYTPENPKPE
ncbi:MAG: monovalent cation:proton antiporter-2 (CPA2) family protein [Parasphingorhabdus sp.]